jgi:hypothetical protein
MDTPQLSAQDLRAAAEVHQELGPQYSDAVLDSFLEKLEDRLQQRVAPSEPARRPSLTKAQWDRLRILTTGAAIGGGIVGIPLGLLGQRVTPFYLPGVHDTWNAILVASICSSVAGLMRLRRRRD